MATTFYTDVAGTSGQSGTKLSDRVSANAAGAPIYVSTSTYTMAGTEAANDLVDIVELPVGATVIPQLSSVVCEAAASTLTFSIGNTDGASPSATQFSAALDLHAAATKTFTGGGADLTPYALTAQSFVQGKFATLVTPVADKKLVFRIAYTLG